MTQETDNDTAREKHGGPENEPFKNYLLREEPVRPDENPHVVYGDAVEGVNKYVTQDAIWRAIQHWFAEDHMVTKQYQSCDSGQFI